MLDYDIWIYVLKEYLKWKGVVGDGEEGRFYCLDGWNIWIMGMVFVLEVERSGWNFLLDIERGNNV